ncbi:hypothetical protein NPIL_247771 [Nephila pilipes]|uniref:Uncharacterized protein n=1 Tax=Nephila pilipes TaxID=299642 RepID=A0A8X6INK9_NEPPI|nr:hypothetical protein NPIL_247771 [Nephila pilipes]
MKNLAKYRTSNINGNSRYQAQYSRIVGVRISPKITCDSYEREGHTARFCPTRFLKKIDPSRTAQDNTVIAVKPNGSQYFPILTAKISVPVEATTNVAELLTTWMKTSHQKINYRFWFSDFSNTQRVHIWSTI